VHLAHGWVATASGGARARSRRNPACATDLGAPAARAAARPAILRVAASAAAARAARVLPFFGGALPEWLWKLREQRAALPPPQFDAVCTGV
jgi:hypothetical protein